MKFNFSDEMRFSLRRAREEAHRLGHDYVGTEHILLGLVAEGLPAAARRLSIGTEEIRREVESRVGRPVASTIGKGELPYTSLAKRALEFAMQEARMAGANNVDNYHLLLAVLREKKGIGARALEALGITRESLIDGVTRRGLDRVHFKVTIDDSSSSSIYEQIIAQVTEAIATGELKPGDRLPTVRQLADDADIAPGTVARAYSQLERDGVVITEGARGTRVAERKIATVPAAERPELLGGLLRPVAVAAFHLGATADELQEALLAAMKGIYDKSDARE